MGDRKLAASDSRPIFGPFQSSSQQTASPMFGPFQTSSPEEANSSPVTERSSLVSSGGVNHSYGNVSVFPQPQPEKPAFTEESKSPLDWLSQGADLGESISTGLKNIGAEKTFGSFGDVFNIYKGGVGLYGGISDTAANGLSADNALDTSKGALDTTAGFAGLLGNNAVKGYAGMASGGIDIYRGLDKAISSSDVGEASAGASQFVEGIGSTISSYGDKTGNPFLMGGGRALNAGMAIGKPLVAATDRHAVNADLYHDEYGDATTGSHRAGMVGRDVQDYLHSTWVPNIVGDVAGGVAAIGTGVGASLVSGAHAVGEALFDSPNFMDIARQQIEQQSRNE
jgi:hypothetical protein